MTMARYRRVMSVREEISWIALHNIQVEEENAARRRAEVQQRVNRGRR